MHTAEAEVHQIVLIIDDDSMITEGLAAGLARAGRTIVTCSDVASAELTIEWLKPSHVVCDVRLTGQFGCEGLDLLRFIASESPDTRTILISGDAPDALQLEASERGAVGFLCKPFEVATLNSLLNLMAPVRRGSPEWPTIINVPTLHEIITTNLLSSVFQPIVELQSGMPIGYEALVRCRTESLLRNPETLFRYASRQSRVIDLELACIRSSLRAAAELPDSGSLFINVHPAAFARGQRLQTMIVAEAEGAGIDLHRLVLEITEQGALGSAPEVLMTIRDLKEAGVRFAFDDVGVAHSHLALIEKIRPSFLKISQDFGTGFESDPTRRKIIRNVLGLARDFDCELILEGIETQSTADAAQAMGIAFGQGYHFARPAAAMSFLPPPTLQMQPSPYLAGR
jgi:EAL domain-containing protein (putative c-di-GMP-specific phosphodiesterase class I)/ActR/RegA family two-component response regulator